MVWTMKTVLMQLPFLSTGAGLGMGAFARPFHAASLEALRLACPFSIVVRLPPSEGTDPNGLDG